MLSKKLYLLEQMLKRHKISAEIDREAAVIKVGKAKMPITQIAIYFIIPVILFVGLLIAHVALDLGRLRVYKFFYGLPITLIAYGANIYLGNKGANKTRKILTADACEIIGKKTSIKVPREEMSIVKTVLHTEDPSGLEGEVFLHTTKGQKCLLFRIRDEKMNYLRDDLLKFEDVLNELWGLEPTKQ